jgi:ATF/CREB family transcription factor
MLAGPTASTDYFDGHLRGGFPTPNESSLRTGLTPGVTPGGGGSMFPAPSPNSQALFQQLANGGATPSTLDFHRTAMNAAAIQKTESTNHTSQSDQTSDQSRVMAGQGQGQRKEGPSDPFGQHDANDAANGLFLLAQARGGAPAPGQYAPAHQQKAASTTAGQTDPSPTATKRGARNISGSMSGSARGMSLDSQDQSESGASEPAKPNTRNRGKRTSGAKGPASNGRRKAEDTPSKGPASKKSKVKSEMPDFSIPGSDEEEELPEHHENGRKMTDEEKRKNFLERNRYEPPVRTFSTLLTSLEGCGSKVSSAKEDVACKSTKQGRNLQC